MDADNLDVFHIEAELKKRWQLPFNWNFKFNPSFEQNIGSIYKHCSLNDLLNEFSDYPEAEKHYAVNRWYNFWSKKTILHLFARHSRTSPIYDENGEIAGGLLDGIPFEIKLYVFPTQFSRTLRYALSHKEELIYWLHRKIRTKPNDSMVNPLFIILYQRDAEHWMLKAEIQQLKKNIVQLSGQI